MLRMSISERSVGTTKSGLTSHSSREKLNSSTKKFDTLWGSCLFVGRKGRVTMAIVLLPWAMWWQLLVHSIVVYKFVLQFLLLCYLNESNLAIDLTLFFMELVFIFDLTICLLHTFWPVMRKHLRVFRRNIILLMYDVLSAIPSVGVVLVPEQFPIIFLIVGRCLIIGRIYKIFEFYRILNGVINRNRKLFFLAEHLVVTVLVLHASTCLWFMFHQMYIDPKNIYNLGYPAHIGAETLHFNSYLNCWYYCACRLYNVIFGDAYPRMNTEKLLTSIITLTGFVFIKNCFTGLIAWNYVLENKRRVKFIDRYHHMMKYLKSRGAPASLINTADRFKRQLWRMKDGVVTSQHLRKLPKPLQMELIFDINVAHFHNTLLFRDTGEAFMRQVSLLMRHEIYLTGQAIWNQGVVKHGMICIKRGVLEMLSDEDDESPMIAFKEGTVLGELSLFYSIPAKVTAKAATYLELQVLRRTDFMRAMTDSPLVLQNIRHKIVERLTKSRERQESIVEYDIEDSRLIRTRYRPMKVLKDHLTGVEEEDPTFIDDSHLYYRDKNNQRQPKFTTEYLELYQISDNVTTVELPKICLRSNFPWILEPNTNFTTMFDVAHFLLVVYVCIVAPYHAILYNPCTDFEIVMNTVVTTGLLFNIYIQLTTAIFDKNVRKVTVKEIAEVKMATVGFYLDILSLFPMYIFLDTMDPQRESAVGQVALLCQTFQVWHIWEYTEKWKKGFNANVKGFILFKYAILITILSYWSGCFLYLYSCPKRICRENSWMSQLIYWETKVFMVGNAKHERPVATSLSLGTSVFTGGGQADMYPGERDTLLIVLIFVLGSYLMCFYTARVCSYYMLHMQRKLKFTESMRELFYFLIVNHVSTKIKTRVRKFFCVQWYYNQAVSSKELFSDMSTNIQQEVLSIEMVDTLLCCPLFQDCSHDFLQTVASNITISVLPDNEVVQHAADIGRDMYILKQGHCNAMSNQGKVICSVGPGSHFGVVEMLYGLPKVYTVVTSTNCILLNVDFSSLIKCWSIFPEVYHPIKAVLDNQELRKYAQNFDEAKPLTGRVEAKINRIAQEIKESFVLLTGRDEMVDFIRTFEKLGILRYLRYFILPGSITPHGLFLKFWCAVRFVGAFFYLLVIPYNFATQQNKHGVKTYYVDFFLYVDLLIMSYVAFYDEKSLLVTHPLMTILHYLKSSFVWDMLTVFPFEFFIKFINKRANSDLYRINRLLQVTRIMGTFSYWESDILRVNQAIVLLKFIPLAMAIVNIATSCVFINNCIPFMMPDSTYVHVNCTRWVFVNSNKYEIKVAFTEYICTFFWMFELFCGCGCSSSGMADTVFMWISNTIFVIGSLYFAFMYGYVASARTSSVHSLLEHSENTKDLENFLYQENVDPILTTKTLKYFEYVWKRTNGSNPQKICRLLNSALMEDTLVFMYEKTLREVPLFGKVERSFIRVITQHLTEMYFLKGDTVIQCRDIQPYIFIIYRGKVDVMNSYNEMITCMGPGGMFGNFTGQPISCSEVTIYASRSLDLLVISSQTFMNLVKFYPKIQEPLNKAFEISRDYILPINMNTADDISSEDSDDFVAVNSDSEVDSRSGSSRVDVLNMGVISSRSSQSNISQSKSSSSVLTFQSYTNIYNLFRPGSWMFQSFGYITCLVSVINYVLVLYEIVTLNDCIFIYWCQTVLDLLFYIKVYLKMHQGYSSKHGDIIIDAAKCRRKYFKNQWHVWTDILCNTPLEVLAFCFPKPIQVIHYLRANKLIRLKYLFEFYKETASELTNNLTTLHLVMTTLVIIVLVHSFTCVWLVTLMGINPIAQMRTLKLHVVNEHIAVFYWNYCTSLYVTVSELTSTGGDEIQIRKISALTILTIGLMIGKMIGAVIVSTAMQVAYAGKHALTKYEDETGELIDELKNQGLSNEVTESVVEADHYTTEDVNAGVDKTSGNSKFLMSSNKSQPINLEINLSLIDTGCESLHYQLLKFWKYIKQLWVTERGRQLPALLSLTPYVRRCDLMSAMYGQYLRSCFLFADTGEAFLRQLTVVLDYTIFFPGNYIVVAGDSEARMFWVASGSVGVVSVRADLTETTHERLTPGDVFGLLQGINRGISHCFSYRAETKVAIITLSLDAWSHILPFFPEAKNIIEQRCETLFSKIS